VFPAVDAPRSVFWTDRLVIRPGSLRLLAVATAVAWVPLVALVAFSLARTNSGGGDSNAAWAEHRAEIRKLSEGPYHLDRFRAIRGRVTDADGNPVAGALVRCAKVESLVELAKGGTPTSSGWTIPIETEIWTDEDGTYNFAHLPVGARTFFYSAPGRDLAPAVKDLIVVQDGLGALLNVPLERPALLRVRLGWSSVKPATRFHLIPHRWWPEVVTVQVPRGTSSVEFRGLGGPFRKGLIAASGPEESSPFRIVGRYDLDRWGNITLVWTGPPASRLDLPEAAALEPWQESLTSGVRRFYAALSPIALLWVPDGDIGPLRLPLAEFIRSLADPEARGTVRGFAPSPFLPVLVRSPWSAGELTWTSEASEFVVDGLPSGTYRARALDLFGRVTFASGSYVGPGQNSSEATRLWAKVDLDEPDSRQVMGFVRWESGAPVEKAVVFMQNTSDYRKYVRRAEADEHGYFRFAGVPGNEPYLVFAMPPGQTSAIKNFDYFGVAAFQREIWRDQFVHPHRVIGSLSDGVPAELLLQLVSVSPKGDAIIWSFSADSSGRFAVENVPHGHYRVKVSQRNGERTLRSLAFDVGDGRSDPTVEWPSASTREH
jgi:hypothetical protein